MGPVKNPPSPQSNLKKDNSSSEDMAPAAKSRRLLNSCLLENQKLLRLTEISDDTLANEKKLDEDIAQQLKLPFFNENNENALNANKKPSILQSVSSSTNSALSAASVMNDVFKRSPDIARLPELYDSSMGTNGEKLENGTAHSTASQDQSTLENHNSNTSSAPEEMENSPFDTKEKIPSLSEWTKDFIGSSLEFSSSVQDTLSDMVSDCRKLCYGTSRQLAASYFSQTATSVDKLIDQHASSQGGQAFMQTSAFRRHGPSIEREHKFCDVYLKPHLKGLKNEFDLDCDSTEESSDEELSFPSGSGNFISGNEPSSMPQSPASTVSDFSTFSTSTDLPQSATHPLPAVEKTFPAERNYLRRRADMHSVWTWLSMRYRAQKRQLKKLNHIYTHLQRTIPLQGSQTSTRRREQLTRSSSPESTPTILTGPPTPVSFSETCASADAEASVSTCSSSSNINDDVSMTSARVRPYVRETVSSGLNSHSQQSTLRSPTHSCFRLLRYHELFSSVCGKSSVQCHCKYPEVYPCILCCGSTVDRELNPTSVAKSTRLQLPPPERLYPRHKLDLSFHEKLSRPADLCHSLSYDESFVSRRPRLYFFSQSQTKAQSPTLPSISAPRDQQQKEMQPDSVTPQRVDHQKQHLPIQVHMQRADKTQQEPQSQEQLQQHVHVHQCSQESTLGKMRDSDLKSGNNRFDDVWLKGSTNGTEVNDSSSKMYGSNRSLASHTAFMRRKRGRRKQHPYNRNSVHGGGVQHGHGDRSVPENAGMRLLELYDDDQSPVALQRDQHEQSLAHQSRMRSQQYRHHLPHHYQQQHQQSDLHQDRGNHQPIIRPRRQMHNSSVRHRQMVSMQQEVNSRKLSMPHEDTIAIDMDNTQRLEPMTHCSKVNVHQFGSLDVSNAVDSQSQLRRDLTKNINSSQLGHGNGGMRSIVVNIPSTSIASGASGMVASYGDTQSSMNRRQSSCSSVPPAAGTPGRRQRIACMSRIVVAPTTGSLDEEDTASVSSCGGSVKSHRSVSSLRMEQRRRSEDAVSATVARSSSVASEGSVLSDKRADIEIPYWQRVHGGVHLAPPEESVVMHLSSHNFANSFGNSDSCDATSNHAHSIDDKEDGKNPEVPSYQLIMLEKPRNGNEVEDTSDMAYVQRHKSPEMYERSSNYPSRGRPGNKASARGDLSVQPGLTSEILPTGVEYVRAKRRGFPPRSFPLSKSPAVHPSIGYSQND